MSITRITEHKFGNITATEKIMDYNGTKWRYTVSGTGDKFLLAIPSNTTGHLLALPLAEEFRDVYTTIALSDPPISSFSKAAEGLKALLDAEGIKCCDAIGQSNGGVHLQNLISHYPGIIHKVVFSHTLTSMDKNDAYTINASEVKAYKLIRRVFKILPISVLTFALGKMVFTPNFNLQSGKEDTDRLIALCKQDLKRVTKQDIFTIADCMEDFLFNYTFTSEPYLANPHNILIVDSPSDTIANPMQREEMLRLCPGAQEYHFPTGGHVTLINCKDEYFSLLHRFFNDKTI